MADPRIAGRAARAGRRRGRPSRRPARPGSRRRAPARSRSAACWHGVQADPGPGEDLLDEHGAAEQVAEGHRDHRDDRQRAFLKAYQRTVRSGSPSARAAHEVAAQDADRGLRVSCRMGGQAVIASAIVGRARCARADQNVSHWPAIRASTTVIPVPGGGDRADVELADRVPGRCASRVRTGRSGGCRARSSGRPRRSRRPAGWPGRSTSRAQRRDDAEGHGIVHRTRRAASASSRVAGKRSRSRGGPAAGCTATPRGRRAGGSRGSRGTGVDQGLVVAELVTRRGELLGRWPAGPG